ncbi:hypothetical protein [Ferrimonas pelagia]|uniref:Uncharacterized protein n=1 Tax=Ferrimonas pelagia TaxID=1177826 RepID=A0ABP9EJS3_9GAMM
MVRRRTESAKPHLNALILIGAFFSASAAADTLLDYCFHQIAGIQAEPAPRQRLAQLRLLQDQLQLSSERFDSVEIGQCAYQLRQALAPLITQATASTEQLNATAQLLHHQRQPLKQLTLTDPRCLHGTPHEAPFTLDLSPSAVVPYLRGAEHEGCRRTVWRRYQSRGYPDNRTLLEAQIEAQWQLAKQAGYRDPLSQQLSSVPLGQHVERQDFLDSLTPDRVQPGWQRSAAPPQPLARPAEQLARQTLEALSQAMALTLVSIDEQQWQLWSDKRLLGYVSLHQAEHNARRILQNHWLGHSPAIIELHYRQSPWHAQHWWQWVRTVGTALGQAHGQEIDHPSPNHGELGRALALEWARQPEFQRSLLGQRVTAPPRYPASLLIEAQLALALWQQPKLNDGVLQTRQTTLYQRYLQQSPPSELWPWYSSERMVFQPGALIQRLYLTQQAQRWVSQQTQTRTELKPALPSSFPWSSLAATTDGSID